MLLIEILSEKSFLSMSVLKQYFIQYFNEWGEMGVISIHSLFKFKTNTGRWSGRVVHYFGRNSLSWWATVSGQRAPRYDLCWCYVPATDDCVLWCVAFGVWLPGEVLGPVSHPSITGTCTRNTETKWTRAAWAQATRNLCHLSYTDKTVRWFFPPFFFFWRAKEWPQCIAVMK